MKLSELLYILAVSGVSVEFESDEITYLEGKLKIKLTQGGFYLEKEILLTNFLETDKIFTSNLIEMLIEFLKQKNA